MFRRAFLIAALIAAVSAATPPRLLNPGLAHQAVLAPGQHHFYRLVVRQQAFVRVVADQRHLDLFLALRDSRGAVVTQTDTFDQGEESLSWIGGRSETMTLDVSTSPGSATRGSYEIRIVDSRPAAETDSLRMAAEAASTEVRRLRQRPSAESLSSAMAQANTALERWTAVRHARSITRARVELADIHHALNQYEEARRHYETALRESKETGDLRTEAEVLNNLAMGFWQQGKTAEASGKLSESRAVWSRLEVTNGRGATLNNIGLLSWQTGQFRAAVGYYQEALDVLRRIGHRRGEAFVLNNLALAYASLGEHARAIDFFERSATAFLAVGSRLEAGRAWSVASKVYLMRNHVHSAERSVARALPLIEPSGDRRGLAEALVNLAEVRRVSSDLSGALQAGERALHLFGEIGDGGGQGRALHALGLIRIAFGEPNAGMPLLEQAIPHFRKAVAREYEASALYSLARAHRSAGEPDRAKTLFESAIEVVDSLRAEAPGDLLRATFLASRLDYFQAYSDLLLEIDKTSPNEHLRSAAFETVERARGRALVDLLRSRQIDSARTGDPALLSRRLLLRRQLSYLLERMARADAASQAQTKAQLDEVLEELRLAEDRIQAADPNAALLFASSRPRLDEIQQALPNDETLLLEYSLGEPRSYVFLVTKTSLDVRELPSRANIEPVARIVAEVLRRRENPRTVSSRLSRMLLEPVKGRLNGQPLLVVADGALHYVPFSALPDPVTGAPLITRHEIINLPSASVLATLRANRSRLSPAPHRLLIVADPVYDTGDARLGKHTRANAKPPQFGRLVFSGRGAGVIASLVPPADRRMLTGFKADKKTLLSSQLQDYRVLHFDVHGVPDDTRPELSGLVLSMVAQNGETRDGFLRLHEITGLQLRADLVVLGSCQSSLGREVRGEGMMALTRGFFYAGASAVVASLWNVDDEASAVLMKHFYEAVFGSGRLRPAAALRHAQLAILARPAWRDPYYWAAHTLQGLEVSLQ